MMTFDRLLELVQVFALPIGGWALRQLSLILGQLKMLNGRISRLESWQEHHERLDMERFQSIQHELDHQRTQVENHRC